MKKELTIKEIEIIQKICREYPDCLYCPVKKKCPGQLELQALKERLIEEKKTKKGGKKRE